MTKKEQKPDVTGRPVKSPAFVGGRVSDKERLRKSQEIYSLVIKETGQLFYDYDIKTGRIEWMGAVKEVTGYSPEEFIFDINDWESMIHPRDRSKALRLLQLARESSSWFVAEYRFRGKDGNYRHIRDTGSFLKEKNDKACRMIGTMADITKQIQAEAAIESSLSLVRATLDSTADGVLVVDRSGTVETMNQKFIDIWRIPPSLTGSKNDSILLDCVLDQLKEPRKFLDKVNQLYSRPSVESFDVLEFKDGRTIERLSKPQKIKNRIVGRVWNFRDVTERKRTEKVNAAVYKISEITNNAENLEELFHSIHTIISELMPARNFYIALYDPEIGLLSFPYYRDEYDEAPTPQPLRRGLTDYVFRHGEPLLADPVKFLELERSGEVESIGAPSIDWLGVPLKVKDKTIGVMVVQTYTEGVRYKKEDRDMLMFVSIQAALAIERKRAEATLREAQRFLSNVFSSIQDGISILTTEMDILEVNSTMEKWYAHATPFKGRKCYEVFHGRKERCDVCPTHDSLQSGQSAYAVVPKIGPGGAVTGWLDLYTFPLIDTATGKMKGVIEYVRDITTRKQAEEALKASLHEKEVLLKEIHHRVKNNMQVISSLLNLQSRHLTDKAAIEMFRESQQRIRSMALVHEKLYQSKDLSRIDFSNYIESLIMFLFHSYRVNSDLIGIKTDVQDILLDINSAIPCGLIINELIMNALKHAFPGGGGGRSSYPSGRPETAGSPFP